MRIVHVVSRSQRRGAERVALDLSEELRELGHENEVVALVLGLEGDEDPALPALVHATSLRSAPRTLAAWRLGRMIERTQADVVLAHGGLAAQVTIAGMPRRRPTVVWQQILGFPEKIHAQPRRGLWWTVARNVDGAVALTDEEADEMRWLGFRGPMWVIPNFRRPQRFFEIDRAVEGARMREELGVDPSAPLIGFVGYLVDQKRPERALEVLADVRAAGVPAHLVIAGEGPLRSRLENEIRERRLVPHVSMLGHRNDVERVFGSVDVALLTSDEEGIPGVAIEAAMTGCPFVTFPLGGVSEVVIDGVTGVVLEKSDTSLMAECVLGLLRDDATRERLGVEARRRSPEFAAPERAKVYAELLEQCVADKAAGRSKTKSRRTPGTDAVRRRGPNLFIVGAPRAGTTFLYHALARADGVYMSPVKEPGFFSSDRAYEWGVEYYLDSCFARAEGSPIRGEATPWYLYLEAARRRIAALDLDEPPRSIVAIRKPSTRAWSMYRAQRQIGSETRPFEEAIETELDQLARGNLLDDIRKRYLWCGFYREHIEAWQQEFGSDRLHVVVFETFLDDESATWVDLEKFLQHDLGEPPFAELTERDKNQSGDLRWPRLDRFLRGFEGRDNALVERAKRALPPGMHRRALQQLRSHNREKTHTPPPAPDSTLMADLDAYFAAENERLAQHIGQDLSSWVSNRVP